MGEQQESKRGRVRRLMIDPLVGIGFRKSGKVSAEKHKAVLAGLADDLVYMGDDGLIRLEQMLRSKGQGPARDVWPSVATVVGFAELIEPRPIEEMPKLLSWFRSVEGPRAKEDGTLVEAWAYFHRHKKPPLMAQAEIQRRAEENRRRLELFKDRIARGVHSSDEAAWVRGYCARLAYCEELVLIGEEARAAKSEDAA